MRAEDTGQRPDPRWTVLIRAEMDTWMPERLPERFRPRSREEARRRRPSGGRPRALQRAWRPLAIAVAVVVLGFVASSVLPSPSSPALPVVQRLIGIRGAAPNATPAPHQSSTVPTRTPVPTTAPPAAQPGAPSSAPVEPAPTAAPQGGAGGSPAPSPGGVPGLPLPTLPPLLPTPTPASQPAATPTPKHCVLGIVCL